MASVADRDRLFRNEQSFTNLKLSLESGANYGHTTAAITANKTVKNVNITVQLSFSLRWHEQEILPFFQAIGNLPCLRNLRVVTSQFSCKLPLPTHFLTEILKGAKKLELLSLYGLILIKKTIMDAFTEDRLSFMGEKSHVEELAKTLEEHSALKEVTMVHTFFEEQNDEQWFFDDLFIALSTVPNLEDVCIRGNGLASASPAAFARVTQYPCLKELTLSQVVVNDLHLVQLAETFEQASCLEELTLYCKFQLKGCRAIARILRADAALRRLELFRHGHSNLEVTGIREIALALGRNSNLKSFVLSGSTITDLKPMVQMIRINKTLEWLDVKARNDIIDPWLKVELHYFLKLNQAGRRRLLLGQQVARQHWVRALCSVEGDLNCLFYLLQSNPSLCHAM